LFVLPLSTEFEVTEKLSDFWVSVFTPQMLGTKSQPVVVTSLEMATVRHASVDFARGAHEHARALQNAPTNQL